MATTGKRRASPETAAHEDEVAKKARLRREEESRIGEEVLKTVRRSYFDDARQASVIYDVWATVLCSNTFARCISDASTMNTPADARERALQEIKAQYIDGATTLVASAKRFLVDLFETRIDSAPANLPSSAVVDEVRVEVDMFTGVATGPVITPWATTVPQTQMVFVCKYTGATLGRTGEGFAFADVVTDPAIVKDQWGCILNFLRAHVALFAKSKFFDTKKNSKRAKALAEIDHAVNSVKAQLGANMEAQYEAASAAAGALLDGLRAKREQLCMPIAVDDTRAAYDAAEERLRQHDAKYKHLFSLTAEDDDDIEREMDRLRCACTKKRGSIDAEVAAALAAYEDGQAGREHLRGGRPPHEETGRPLCGHHGATHYGGFYRKAVLSAVSRPSIPIRRTNGAARIIGATQAHLLDGGCTCRGVLCVCDWCQQALHVTGAHDYGVPYK